nr:MAG TPA: hypothetical protein [Caudoviricetes sp.]
MSYTDVKLEKYIDILENAFGISEDVIDFAVGVYGYNEKTLENILYYYTGYNCFDQLENEE